jgi:hypothetical protein
VRPTAILWLHFASDESVLDYSAIGVCGTRRVNFNVGDASCPRGFGGSMGAATSAMLVRDDLRKAI